MAISPASSGPSSSLTGCLAQAFLTVPGALEGPAPTLDLLCAGRLQPVPVPGAKLAGPPPAASTAWERSSLPPRRVFWEGRDAAPGAVRWVQQEVELAELGV